MDHLRRAITAVALAGTVLFAVHGCGGGSGSPAAPTPPGGGSSGATITITAAGLSPASVTVVAGQRVTFVNNGDREMTVASDPHPTHTDCPAINSVGTLQPGQTRLTAEFPTARSCGFHDHNRPDDASRRGTIAVQ